MKRQVRRVIGTHKDCGGDVIEVKGGRWHYCLKCDEFVRLEKVNSK